MNFYNLYRPHQFADVLGQEQSVAILKGQALMGHYHHAYLFFGASGTGKTTTARILAMCLNCQSMNGNGEPCGKCPSCQSVIKGQHWDIFEIDGARFRGIDDVKELAYKAYLAPMGNYKVYIIDECHQLTEPAWNGMLKLLEEPPPHLVIILCTTHFEKIPDTITSRCQLYPFGKLKPEQIQQKLKLICQGVGINPDPKHIQFIVESSNGNMRSAENTLEQVCQIKGGSQLS
jgi:DNA polymerase-3 subunit gamma/tau